MLAMLILLRVVSEAARPLSALRQEVEPYYASGEINFVVDDPGSAIARVEARFPEAVTDQVDGLSMDLGDVWFNLRASNTEPLLRLNVESGDEQILNETVAVIESTLEEVG
jgi:phosphomannomutase